MNVLFVLFSDKSNLNGGILEEGGGKNYVRKKINKRTMVERDKVEPYAIGT